MKILETSPVIQERNAYRICRQCGEICLCHEERCPNCDSGEISESSLEHLAAEAEKRIRCRFRYQNMRKDKKQ